MPAESPEIYPPTFGPVSQAFIDDEHSRFPAIVGPVGSGKSTAACYKLMRMACAIDPCRDGVRRSRSIIVRNSYRELVDSSMRTFFKVVPQQLGELSKSDFTFRIKTETLDAEFCFRSFDTAADLGKLLSTEYSFGLLSEARELPVDLFDMLPARLRYPSQIDVPGFTGKAIIESNPGDPSHWMYDNYVERHVDGCTLYMQPSGLSEHAENVANLPPNYYQTISAGKAPAWVDCFVHAKWVFYGTDMPVFPEFIQSIHVAREPIPISRNLPLLAGLDFGLTPAAGFIQIAPSGQYRVVGELCTTNMGALQFGAELKAWLLREYGTTHIDIIGDPAGEQRSQTDMVTPYDILARHGINARPAHTNDWTIRRETLARLLTGRDMAGDPALIVSPVCKTAIRGLSGDYRYQRMQVSGSARFAEKPIKTASSHICEAIGYGLLGCGEDQQVVGGYDRIVANTYTSAETAHTLSGYRRKRSAANTEEP